MEFTNVYHRTSYPSISSSNPSLSASGKVILITGGSKGIGKAIATSFVTAGAKAVVITGRTKSTLQLTKEQLSTRETAVEYFIADTVDHVVMAGVFSKVVDLFGKIDVFICNAGWAPTFGTVDKSDLDDIWLGFEINVKGVIITAKEFLKVASPGATFINITSAAAHVRYLPGTAAYSASKSASTKLVEYLQLENPQYRIFNVHPGAIMTDMGRKTGYNLSDQEDLPGDFCVWLVGGESDFLKGRFVWTNWDVDEMKEKEKDIAKSDLLVLTLDGMQGVPTNVQGEIE